MAKMKLKKLEEFLQGVDGFDKPKLLLEQYVTPSHIASNMLFAIQSKYGDLENKIVADLGCGSGMLSIGPFLLGAQLTVGFDIDLDALNILQRNVNEMEIVGVECVACDVLQNLRESKWKGVFQTVIMNPPFGTKHNAGMDIKFLKTGIALAEETVYSLHKTSTRDFIKKKITRMGNTS